MKILGNSLKKVKKNLKNLRPLQSCLRKLRNRLHRSSVCKQKQQQWRSPVHTFAARRK